MNTDILKIGVTGSAGSGKSHVCQHFKTIGLVTLDCDMIAREVVDSGTRGLKKIIELFGQVVVDKKGKLDRAKLRTIIISDSIMRKKLEAVLHPLINKEMVFQMENAEYRNKQAVAVEVPLLFELGMEKYFDVTIVVVAKDMDLVKRICNRDNAEEQDAQKMLDLQMSQDEKQKKADHIIINSGDISELPGAVNTVFNQIQKDSKKRILDN